MAQSQPVPQIPRRPAGFIPSLGPDRDRGGVGARQPVRVPTPTSMAPASRPHLTGHQKAAALLIELGADTSANILKQLPQELVEQLTVEITKMTEVTPDVAAEVAAEAVEEAAVGEHVAEGGVAYVKDMLTRALGEHDAEETIRRAGIERHPFDFLYEVDPEQVATFLGHEHAQTIAVVLAHLDPAHAAGLLDRLPEELQADVALRIATLEFTPPDVIDELERLLQARLIAALGPGLRGLAADESGGAEYMAEVLNQIDGATERTILDAIEEADPDIAGIIKDKMFVFDDIADLDDRALQRVLREVDNKDLALALRGTSESLKQKVLANMSTHAAQMLREELEIMGPVRGSIVEAAQHRITSAARRLDELEEITIGRADEDQLLA